jgi:glutamate dehydrogenase/leucine dehydrogenase
MTAVVVQKLADSDAFIVSDLDGAPRHVGIVRLAPKILVDGATTLARSMTYLFASFEQQIGGGSAGINAKPDDRASAIEAFVAQVGPQVADGSLDLRAGKGLGDTDLEPLRTQAPSPGPTPGAARSLLGPGAVAAAVAARDGLDGARVAIDGLEPASSSILDELAGAGATVVAVSTTAGTVADPAGIDPARLSGALIEHGAAAVEHLDLEVAPAAAIFAADADVLFVGSKVGAIDHETAAGVTAGLVVPIGPVPVTAKALAVLRRADAIVLPDFVTVAGPWFSAFADAPATVEALRPVVVDAITSVIGEVRAHDDGPLLGACYRAEGYLRSWRESLPFGRPLA